jgi:hypothetical protein
MDTRSLPDNREDPRFRQTQDAHVATDWPWSDCGLQWSDVLGALLEGLPMAVERLLR